MRRRGMAVVCDDGILIAPPLDNKKDQNTELLIAHRGRGEADQQQGSEL